jgi:mRNA-degrading endonuclease RelE of RelBE toxin-antitoxin system
VVDRLTKSLRRLARKDRRMADQLVSKLIDGDFGHLKIKKLRGIDNVFRARKGRVRVVYRLYGRRVIILDVDLRSDTTYKRY